MGLEILFWIWVLTWMTKTAATDVIYSLQGQVPPRKRERLARAESGEVGPQRYGFGGWFADLKEDALLAHTEKRRGAVAGKSQGRPIDDLVEAVREPKSALPSEPERDGSSSVVHEDQHPYCLEPCGPTCGREAWRCGRCGGGEIGFVSRAKAEESAANHRCPGTPTDPNGVASCVKCGGTAVVDGVPCADCLAVQQQRNDEWARRVQGLGRDDRVVVALDPSRYCGNCGAEFSPEQRQLGASDLLCRECLFRTPQGQPWVAVRTKPTATNVIPLFPNTKEINMANIEATGLDTAIAFADAAASAHNSFATSGSEGYVGALERMEMGPEYIGAAREAMEASTTAAAKWADLSEKLATQKTGQEFYRGNSDAGGKAALTAE